MILMSNRISSTCRAVACVLLIFSAVSSSTSQTNPDKSATASVAGKVTVKNKAVAGIVVIAEEPNPGRWPRSSYRATTDQTGSYRITNIPAGTYRIRPMTPALAPENEPTNNSIVLGEGEIVEDVNFSMVPGGVITGKVTDAEGKPLIAAFVSLVSIDSGVVSMRDTGTSITDDRGIYRVFGLKPGKYKIFFGGHESLAGAGSRFYRQTYYPSVNDVAKATVIEVTEGSETTNVDIVLGPALPAFKVSGRIIDAETGKPLPGINYGLYKSDGERGGSSSVGREFTDPNGGFRLENVLPGKYAVFVAAAQSNLRADWVYFEVVDQDIADLVIKAGKAGSVSGVVVFEGAEDKTIKFDALMISAWMRNGENHFAGNTMQPLDPDGRFRIGGLTKGLARLSVTLREPNDTMQVAAVRVERNGVFQPDGLDLKDGEQVTGVRVIAKYLTGVIQGEIKLEGEESLPNSRISVWINAIDLSRPGAYRMPGGKSPELDARKRFVVRGLAAGTYEVNVAVFDPARQDTTRIYKQQVTVTDFAVSEVTITIKTKP